MKIGPKFKIARRLGERIFPKTQTTKFAISGSAVRTSRPPRRGGGSDYGGQLIEKQKARYTYGLSEHQFSGYVQKSRAAKKSAPMMDLFQNLEARLDNALYRLGWVPSRAAGRQAVVHGHIFVNGRKVDRPSYHLKSGDKISIRVPSRTNSIFKDMTERIKEGQKTPAWLGRLADFEAEVKGEPLFGEFESNIDFSAIIEFYSRV